MVADRDSLWRLWLRVLEGRHVRWRGVESRLAVRAGRLLQTGTPRPAASSPYYGEEFTFEFQEPLEELLDKTLVLSVQQARNLIPRNKVLASMEMDLATVWAYPDHQVVHKWAVLWCRGVDGPAGFLLVDVAILGHGNALRLPPAPVHSDLLFENLLLPSWADPVRPARATYLVRVYRANGLPLRKPAEQAQRVYQSQPPSAPATQAAVWEGEVEAPPSPQPSTNATASASFPSGRGRRREKARAVGKLASAPGRRERARKAAIASCKCGPQYCVRVTFAGQHGETSLRGCDCRQPVWDEQLSFADLYPPLHQRMHLQLRRSGRMVCEHRLHLDKICEDMHSERARGGGGGGVLFGPWWIGLRGDAGRGRRRRCRGPWQGRMLVSLVVLCADHHRPPDGPHRVLKEATTSISEVSLWRQADVVLVAVLWDAFLLDRRQLHGKDLGLDMSLGSAGDRHLWQHQDADVAARQLMYSSCSGLQSASHDGAYLHVTLGRRKPLLAVRTFVPDLLRDLKLANALQRLGAALREAIRSVRRLHRDGGHGGEDHLRGAVSAARAGLEALASLTASSHGTRMMQQLVTAARAVSSSPAALLPASCDRAAGLAERMLHAADETEAGIGAVFLWLTRGRDGGRRERCGVVSLPARHVLHAREVDERGRHAGQLTTLVLHRTGQAAKVTKAGEGAVVGILEVLLWLGPRRDAHLALQGLPAGHDGDLGTPARLTIPPVVVYAEEYTYECWAHVWHGRFRPGADRSGLNDPFVRVVCGPHSAQTQVVPGSLVPCWACSLRLPAVRVCGDPADVARRPPTVVVEAWDRDACTNEFLGHALVRPRVVLLPQQGRPHPDPHSDSPAQTGSEPDALRADRQSPAVGLRRGRQWTQDWNAKWNQWRGRDEEQIENDRREQSPSLDQHQPPDPGVVQWLRMMSGSHRGGDVLAALHLVQIAQLPTDSGIPPPAQEVVDMPDQMTTPTGRYRLELVFWGLRDVRPTCAPGYHYVAVHVGSTRLESCRLDPAASLNFQDPYAAVDLDLPLDQRLMPAVHIVLQRRAALWLFRRSAATHLLPSAALLLRTPTAPAPSPAPSPAPWTWLPTSLAGTTMELTPLPSRPPGPVQSEVSTSSESHVIDMSDENGEDVEDPLLARSKGIEDDCPRPGLLSRLASRAAKAVPSLPQRVKNLRNVGGGAVEAVRMRLPRRRGREGAREDKDLDPDPDPDWWTRYYATVQARAGEGDGGSTASRVHEDFLLEIYPNELEEQVQFEGFQDFLRVLPLCRGKRVTASDDDDEDDVDDDDVLEDHENLPQWNHNGKVMAQLKVAMRLHRLDLPRGSVVCGADRLSPPLPRRPSQAPARPLAVVVRVYVVRALALPPRDANGSCDPYLVVKLGRQKRNDVQNRIRQNLNPIFGRVFEFETEFPRDHALTVRVMDWDLAGRDDVIGETRIDLENRVFSRHMGRCGIPKRFSLKGNNRWRDSRLPSELLAELAVDHGLPPPRYEGSAVTVGDWTVSAKPNSQLEGHSSREHTALAALHVWHHAPGAPAGSSLVPQHVETRSLYHPARPSIEQGQLEIWVDVLVPGTGVLPPAVALDPPSPSLWELRVVVWEASGVVGTERVLLSKNKSSDVYVKGWMSGLERYSQSTDVHFACLSGDALWSWRLVYRFQHIWPEDRIVTEDGGGQGRHPPRLHLALMDYDTFTSDDVLGTLSLDLSRLPRGSVFAANCTAPSGKDSRSTVNLFKARHTTGWWPALLVADVDKPRSKGLGGKLRLELSLLPAASADHAPAGEGREGPQALEKPQRPVEAFSMLRHPVLGMYHFVWRRHRRMLVIGVLVFLIAVFVLVAVYSLPGLLVKKVLNA